MSFINGLLIGVGEGLRRGSEKYFEALDKRRQRQLQDEALVEDRLERVRRAMREHDEFEERKRATRKQEELEHERNVQSSLDRMLERENRRYAADEATRRAVETALLRAQQAREREAAITERARTPRPRQPNPSNPDGLTATQREGLMLLKREYTDPQEKADFEAAWRKARAAFPNAHPGDVAVAAQRYLDRIKKDRGY